MAGLISAEIGLVGLIGSMLLIILFTLFFETGLHVLTNWLKDEGLSVFLAVVDKVSGELMILGCISFVILMIIEASVDLPSDSWIVSRILMLELAHVWIFAIGLMFATLAVAWMGIAGADRRRWTSFDLTSSAALTQTILDLAMADERWITMGGEILHSLVAFRERWLPTRAAELIEFNLLRRYFLAKFFPLVVEIYGEDLALTPARADKSFKFGSLLNRIMEANVQEQMEVSSASWGVFVLVLVLGITMNWITAVDYHRHSLRWVCLLLSWFTFAFVIALFIAIHSLRHTILSEASMELGFDDETSHLEVVRELGNAASRGRYRTVALRKEEGEEASPPPPPKKKGALRREASTLAPWHQPPPVIPEEKTRKRMLSRERSVFIGAHVVAGVDRIKQSARRVSMVFGIDEDEEGHDHQSHDTPRRRSDSFAESERGRTRTASGLTFVDMSDATLGADTVEAGQQSTDEASCDSTSSSSSSSSNLNAHSVSGHPDLTGSETMRCLQSMRSPAVRGRMMANLIPKMTEKTVLFQLGLLSFLFVLGIPEGLGVRKGVNYQGSEGHDPYTGIFVFVILSLLPLLLGLLVVQPMILKDATLLSSVLCSDEHKRSLLFDMHERVVEERDQRARFIQLVRREGRSKVDFLFASPKIQKMMQSPNLKRWLRKSGWTDVEENTSRGKSQKEFILTVASALHEMWRGARKEMEEGGREPRIKKVNGVEYDIANLSFLELPIEFQRSNYDSAKCVCGSLGEAITRGSLLGDAFVEWASDELHEDWMVHNRSWADPSQMVTYAELSEDEKEKDRVIVRAAVKIYNANMAVTQIVATNVVTIAIFGAALKQWGVELIAVDLKMMWQSFAPLGQCQCLTVAKLQEQVDEVLRVQRSRKQMTAGMARMRIRLAAIRTSKQAVALAKEALSKAVLVVAECREADMQGADLAQMLCDQVMENVKTSLAREAETFRKGIGAIFPTASVRARERVRRKSAVMRAAAARLLTDEEMEEITNKAEREEKIAEGSTDALSFFHNKMNMTAGKRNSAQGTGRGLFSSRLAVVQSPRGPVSTSWPLAVASKLHDLWRSNRKKMTDGSFEPRLAEVDERSYDIANLSFFALPSVLQESNYNSATCAINSLRDATGLGVPLDDDFVEWAAAKQHDDWCVAACQGFLSILPSLICTYTKSPTHLFSLAHLTRAGWHIRMIKHGPMQILWFRIVSSTRSRNNKIATSS